MFWNSLFSINLAQGLFLITVFFVKRKNNPIASLLITAMILIMVITNFGYLVIRTDLLYYIPQAYLLPFGSIFLMGPLFYFYVKSFTQSTFAWEKKYYFHFIPYVIQVIYFHSFYTADKESIITFVNYFLNGTLPVNNEALVLFAIQEIHLITYMFLSFRLIKKYKEHKETPLILPRSQRYKWLKEMFILFLVFSIMLVGLYTFIALNGKYNPVTNFVYTVITSAIIYFISYKAVFSPELINPDFTEKYRTYKSMDTSEEDMYSGKLMNLMEKEKIYINPELKLSMLAEKTGLAPHRLSRMINEKFGKSFNDYINEYRVNEFIQRLNDPDYKSLSIYGIALDVGFNSKSSFNTAFKKITGKNPSDYKIH